jgi:integrase
MQAIAKSNIFPITSNTVNRTLVKLTNKIIINAMPRATRYAITDTNVTGLRLHVLPSGRKKFLAVGRVRKTHKIRTITLGDASVLSLEDARIAAKAFLTQLQLGIDANEVNAVKTAKEAYRAITLNEALEAYLGDRVLKVKTIIGYRYELPKYCSNFIHKPVNKITEDDVCQWYLDNNNIPTSIDKAFRSLRAILEYMVGTKVISHNPCSAVTARKLRYKIKARTRRIETYHLTAFMDSWLLLMQEGTINPLHGDFILWLLMTGCRLNEARTLKWSDLNNELLTITILDTKNGHPHVLPLTPLMSDLLDRRKQYNPSVNSYLFPAMQGRKLSDSKHLVDCRKTLDKITCNANIPKVRPHDLRRSFTTMLDELDISESNIKALLNHNDGTVTRKHYLQATNIEVKRRNLWAVGKNLEQSITVKGKHPVTNKACIFACVGSIRQFIYGTSICDFSIIKGNETAKSILDAMR